METTAELRVLILTPRGRDADLAAAILTRTGIASRVCAAVADLTQSIAEGAGAVLISEEALEDDEDERALLWWVAKQPAWSDFPFIVLAAPHGDVVQGAWAPAWFSAIGNAVLLERPLSGAVLASAVRAALRARRKQYEVRTYFAEWERATERLAALNALLETRVAERTAELRAAYDKLEKEAAERERAEARLAQAHRMEALGQLAGGIAHDFNNVLHAVSGGLALIQSQSGDADAVRRLAHMADKATQRGATITGRLLAFARRDALRATSVRPVPMLESLREMLAYTLGVNIAIRIAADRGVPSLLADKGQLETVLVNLAVNGRDAMPAGGTLRLACAFDLVVDNQAHPAELPPGGYVRLSVSDTGTGMDAATLARASDPFFTTKPLGQGTGLGLAMARGFAQQSGGGFAIDSLPGQGTTVTLWFPQTADVMAAGEPMPLDRTPFMAPASSRVLVVDDDVSVREVMVDQMAEEGYCVTQACDGLEALAQLDAGAAVDLLISDYAMPGMDGLMLIQEVRRRWPALPALLVTGYAEESVQLAVADAQTGNTALLHKPVSARALANGAATLLANAAALPV